MGTEESVRYGGFARELLKMSRMFGARGGLSEQEMRARDVRGAQEMVREIDDNCSNISVRRTKLSSLCIYLFRANLF
jgi:hypothetical protein